MKHYAHTIETWDKLAKRYQESFMDMDMYDDSYDAFCDLARKPGAHIFEIGCGPGNITRYLLSKRPDFRIDAIDVAPGMIELARQNVPAAHFTVMDCRDLHRFSGIYDGILCGFCMPYLSGEDCESLIRESARLLAPGGIWYGSVIEDDYSNSRYETSSDGQHKMFVYYYREEDLKKMLKTAGLDTLTVFKKEFTKRNGIRSTHLILLAIRNP